MVHLHRRTGGVSGIYRCEIPDLSGVNQTLYVGLYAISIQESGKQCVQCLMQTLLMLSSKIVYMYCLFATSKGEYIWTLYG